MKCRLLHSNDWLTKLSILWVISKQSLPVAVVQL
jgi:hypothetical protein